MPCPKHPKTHRIHGCVSVHLCTIYCIFMEWTLHWSLPYPSSLRQVARSSDLVQTFSSPHLSSSEGWLRWKSRTTVSDRFNGLIKVFDEFTLSYLFIAQLFRILRLFKGHFRTWPNRPNSSCAPYTNNPSKRNAEGCHPFGVSVFNESIRYKYAQILGMTHPKT